MTTPVPRITLGDLPSEMTRSEAETFDICGFCGGKVYADDCLDCGRKGSTGLTDRSDGTSSDPETWGYVIERDKAGCSGQAVLQAIIAYLRGPSGVGETFADAETKLRRAKARTYLLAVKSEHGPRGCRAVNMKTGAPLEYYVLANAQGSIIATRILLTKIGTAEENMERLAIAGILSSGSAVHV